MPRPPARSSLLGITLPRADEVSTAVASAADRTADRLARWFGGTEGEATARHDPRPLHHRPAVLMGILLFIGGLMMFAWYQTQQMFKDSLSSEVSAGLVARNDGGILFGALLAGIGLATVLASLSPRAPKRRMVPILGIIASTTGLLFLHFTIFVNSFTIPGEGMIMLRASFIFHDSASFLPMAVFVLALVTLILILLGAMSVMALIAPRLMRERFIRPTHADSHRTRLVLTALTLVLVGGTFVHQFVYYALGADAEPTGGFVATNRVLLYYLLAISLSAAIATTVWHTRLIVWGDLRDRRSLSFQRSLIPLHRTETWLWAATFALNLLVLFPEPVYTPSGSDTSRVFAMNSRGASIFLLLLFGGWGVHRWSAKAWLRHLRDDHGINGQAKYDRLFFLATTVIGIWLFTWFLLLALPSLDHFGPTPNLLIRIGAVALVLPFFAMRIQLAETGLRPRLAHHGAPMTLLLFAGLAIVTGLMLWGTGNTITTFYSRSGGFVNPEESVLQPYATGIQLLGSLFIGLPLMLGLWYLGARHDRIPHPAPILVAAFATVLAMNMVMTIQTEDVFDSALGQTDVLVGYRIVNVASTLDTSVLLGVWAATLLAALGGSLMVLKRAADKSTRLHDVATASPSGVASTR
ncbi:MAG: hypothetical protein KY455_00125 [Euryarchaeota archaeon]|nr:hypothetical protein [Euryarchaeota archaeon]